MTHHWTFQPYGAIDDSPANAADRPFGAIAATRSSDSESIEVAVVGEPDGTVRIVVTGSETIAFNVVDDR